MHLEAWKHNKERRGNRKISEEIMAKIFQSLFMDVNVSNEKLSNL